MTPRSFIDRTSRGLLVAILSVFLLGPGPGRAPGQSYDPDSILAAEGYITPPDTIMSAALAPRWQNFSFSNPNADGCWYLQSLSDGLPHIRSSPSPTTSLAGSSSTLRRTATVA